MSRRLYALLALPLVFSAACSLVPGADEPEQLPSAKGPQFDADYYALNAKEYMNGGQYGRAKAQWETYLTFVPGDWMARLGIAYADVFIAEEAVAASGDIKLARKLLAEAKTTFAELKTGPLEEDTQTETKTPMWKALLGTAMTARYAGYLDQIEARREAAASLKADRDAAERRAEAERFQRERDRDYAEAVAAYEQLAAMKNASPEAVLALGQLYLVTHQDAKAERELNRYLDFARSTRKTLETGKQTSREDEQVDRAAMVATIYDQKLEGNAAKQAGVLDDLAGLAFARGDYRGSKRKLEEAISVKPDRADLYFKLAQTENELQMYESAIGRLDEFLKRASQRREDFDERIYSAMKLKQDLERKLGAAGRK
jgi:hypothetical protein